MKVIDVRNVEEALFKGLTLLIHEGQEQKSRNGDVLCMPCPVTTVYRNPTERLVLIPERDTNVAFLVYEALWMLAGRDDLKGLTRYVKTFANYSDDGVSLHGAYGHRWRFHFGGQDQLKKIIHLLRENPDDRRIVLQMWDCSSDLGIPSKDIPCNLMATFQAVPVATRYSTRKLNMVVFNRSNDILWGAYFANAFHFSVLLQYLAQGANMAVGTYTQVSSNYHVYKELLQQYDDEGFFRAESHREYEGKVFPLSMDLTTEAADALIDDLLLHADCDSWSLRKPKSEFWWIEQFATVLHAHSIWQKDRSVQGFEAAIHRLDEFGDFHVDVIYCMRNWLARRLETVLSKEAGREATRVVARHAFIQSKYHPNACNVQGCYRHQQHPIHG